MNIFLAISTLPRQRLLELNVCNPQQQQQQQQPHNLSDNVSDHQSDRLTPDNLLQAKMFTKTGHNIWDTKYFLTDDIFCYQYKTCFKIF